MFKRDGKVLYVEVEEILVLVPHPRRPSLGDVESTAWGIHVCRKTAAQRYQAEHGEHQVGRKLIWRDSPAAPAAELEILSWEPGVGDAPGYYVTINEHRQRRLVRLADFQTVEHVSAAWAPCENVTDSSEEDA